MKQVCRPKKKAIIMLTLKLFVVRFCRFGSICMDPLRFRLKASELTISARIELSTGTSFSNFWAILTVEDQKNKQRTSGEKIPHQFCYLPQLFID